MEKLTSEIYEKMNNPLKFLEIIEKTVKYLPNGVGYVKTSTKDSHLLKDGAYCDHCNKKIEDGYLVWATHSYFCDKCFQKYIVDYKLIEEEDIMLELQKDISTFIWYLSYFDKDVYNTAIKINMGMLKQSDVIFPVS